MSDLVNPWRTALPDWEARIMAGQSLVPELPLFRQEAAKALRIFRRLRLPDVIGKPTMAVACGPWFFPIVEALFGSYDVETHRRMIQEVFQLIPKGNAKSSNGGAVMATALIMNRRPEGEFDLIAPTIKIASIAFNQAKGTIRSDPELDALFQCRDHIRTIEHRTMGSKLQIKAADTDVVTGGKAVGTMIDETHVFAKRANAADIFIEIRGALGKRPDGFLWQTTTQSKEPPSGQFKIELERARDVRDGMIERPTLPILYEPPKAIIENDAWRQRKYWPVMNPNLGRSLDEEFLVRTLADAEREGKEQMALVASQHFNVEIGMRMRADRWRGADFWEQAGFEPIADFDTFLERCEVVVVGVDGGGLDDLLGFCALGRDKKTKVWLYWNRAFAHRKVLDRRKEIAPALLDYEQDGDLVFWGKQDEPAGDVVKLLTADGDELEMEARTVSGDVDPDIAAVVQLCVAIRDRGLLPEAHGIGADPAAIGALLDALVAAGFTLAEGGKGDVVGVSQSATNMFSAINTLERKLEGGTAAHGGTRLMAFCVSNAKAELRGNAVAITKAQAGKAKIDPLVAAFVATKLMERNPEAAEGNGGFDGWLERLRA
jgi:phage terminase large subunit-like protein